MPTKKRRFKWMVGKRGVPRHVLKKRPRHPDTREVIRVAVAADKLKKTPSRYEYIRIGKKKETIVAPARFKVKISVERWKNGRFAVARRSDNNRAISYRRYRNEKLSALKKKFRRDKTLRDQIYRKKKLTDFTMETYLTPTSMDITKDEFRIQPSGPSTRARPGKDTTVQYVVEAKLADGRLIVARSRRIHAGKVSKRFARIEAWENLLRLLSEDQTGAYDLDEGIDLVESGAVKTIREGWIVYRRIK